MLERGSGAGMEPSPARFGGETRHTTAGYQPSIGLGGCQMQRGRLPFGRQAKFAKETSSDDLTIVEIVGVFWQRVDCRLSFIDDPHALGRLPILLLVTNRLGRTDRVGRAEGRSRSA
jgi:hypothetical protein